ncbi:MAG: DUF58 domain-containing protein [Thermoanaerobaculales bacterium]
MKRLEIRARQAMESGLAGQYQSAFRGLGLEFEEVREYRTGDDVRTIDWNVTARTGSLHVKRYREERDLTMLLLVDLSASTRFGSGVMTVHDLIAEVAGLFALAAARRDRVGAILFDEGVRTVIPPRSGWRHGLRVVREVLAAEPAGHGTALADAVRAAGRLLHRRGVVIILTDQACELPQREVVALSARHEVVVVRVGDDLLEKGLDGAVLPVVDAESGRRGVVRGRAERRPSAALPGIDHVVLSTGRDYLPAVRAMLERRERRRVR